MTFIDNRFATMTARPAASRPQYFEEKKKGEMNELKKYPSP
jgi:hypothetical protein